MAGMGGVGEAERMGGHAKNKTKTCYMHIWRCHGETCSFFTINVLILTIMKTKQSLNQTMLLERQMAHQHSLPFCSFIGKVSALNRGPADCWSPRMNFYERASSKSSVHPPEATRDRGEGVEGWGVR